MLNRCLRWAFGRFDAASTTNQKQKPMIYNFENHPPIVATFNTLEKGDAFICPFSEIQYRMMANEASRRNNRARDRGEIFGRSMMFRVSKTENDGFITVKRVN